MNFDFKAIAKSPPGICIICGVALAVISGVGGLGGGLFGFGVFLVIAGIVLQVIYLYLKYRGQ